MNRIPLATIVEKLGILRSISRRETREGARFKTDSREIGIDCSSETTATSRRLNLVEDAASGGRVGGSAEIDK